MMRSCSVAAHSRHARSRLARAALGLAHIGALAVLFAARPAHACTCMGSRLTRSVLPADGAREVPTDGIVRVFLSGGWPSEARQALRGEYRLVDEAGAVVPTESTLLDTTLTLTPTSTLAPGRTYSVERLYLYRRGEQLSDEHRVALAQRDDDPGRAHDERRWFADSRFHTSRGPARAAPARVRLLSTEPYYGDQTSCGPTSQLTVAYTLDRDVGPLEVLALELEGRGLLRLFEPPARRRDALVIRAGMCTPDPLYLGADPPPVRVVLLDGRGQAIATSAYAAAGWVGPLRERPEPAWPTPRPQPRLIERFAASPIGLTPAAAAPGPAGCPYGLRSLRRWSLAATGMPRSYGLRGSVGGDAQRGWAVLSDEHSQQSSLVVFGTQASTRVWPLTGRGSAPLAADDRRGGLVLVRTLYRDDTHAPPELDVRRLDLRGKTTWARRLAAGSSLPWPSLVAGDGHALLTWRGGSTIRHRMVLSLDDGHTLSATVSEGSSASDEATATAWDGTSYWRAESRRPLEVLRLSPSADVLERWPWPAAQAEHPALAASTTGPWLAWSDRRGVWLAPAREPERARRVAPLTPGHARPALVQLGRGAGPALWVVAWEASPRGRVHAAVVDAQGHTSPPLALGDQSASTVTLSTTDDGVLLLYAERGEGRGRDSDDGAVVEQLGCALTPPAGAPMTIAR
jgi:hypothetical protein